MCCLYRSRDALDRELEIIDGIVAIAGGILDRSANRAGL